MTITQQEYETRLKLFQKESAKKRMKEYARKNRKEYFQSYYQKNREKIIEQQRVYRDRIKNNVRTQSVN